MSRAEQRGRDSAMASHLIAMGYPHGRRFTKGVTNVPPVTDVGSAAYRRLAAKRKRIA